MQDGHDGFDDFMERHYKMMVNFCNSRTGSGFDADSIVNDSFNRLWMKWSERKNSSEEDNRKWLYNAILLIVKEEYRNNKKHLTNDIEEHSNDTYESDFTEYTLGEIAYLELKAYIESSLKPFEIKLFNMKILNDVEYKVLEKEFGESYLKLRVKVHRLKKKIEKLIEQYQKE